MRTAQEKKSDYNLGLKMLESFRPRVESGNYIFLISEQLGQGMTDYYRVTLATSLHGKTESHRLTFAIATALGYRLHDQDGRWKLAISGGNFSKTDEIARALGRFYGVGSVRYDTL